MPTRPLRDRRDYFICTAVGDGDPDAAARDMIAALRKQHGHEMPPMRIIPLADRTVYDEAYEIMIARFAAHRVSAWRGDVDRAEIVFRDVTGTEQRHRFRIVEALTN